MLNLEKRIMVDTSYELDSSGAFSLVKKKASNFSW